MTMQPRARSLAVAAVLVRLVIPLVARAADYYVDPNGADTNSGLSPAEAFRSIQQGADSAAPGDTVHISGGTYDEVVSLTRSGSLGSPITIRADGAVVMDGQNRQCLAGEPVLIGAAPQAIVAANVHDVVLDGIEVTRYCYAGIVARFSSNITLRNLHVHHNGVTLRTDEGNGIGVQGGANILVESNVVTDNAPRNRFSGSGIGVDGADQVTVRDNLVERNNGNGILIEDCTNALVDGNRVRFNVGDLRSWGTGGIWVDGGHTITVRGNWFEGNVWAGLEITDETPSDPYGYEIYNNVALGNWYGMWLDGIGQIGQAANLIYGNTFVDNTVAGIRLVGRTTSPLSNTQLIGNLVAQIDQDRPALQVDPGTYPAVVLDHNLLFRSGSTRPVNWGFAYGSRLDTTPIASADRTLTEYQALSGWGSSDLSADPLLVDATHGDFHLLAGSPAVDAAAVYAAPADYDGHTRSLGAGPDIGAFEGAGPCGGAACLTGTPAATAYDSSVDPLRPVIVTIPPTAVSVTRLLKVKVRNRDALPTRDRLGHRIQLIASDGDCPPGTIVGAPAFRYQRVRGPEASDVLAGGRSQRVIVAVTFTRAAFPGGGQCTLHFAAITPLPGNVDPVPGNDGVAVQVRINAP